MVGTFFRKAAAQWKKIKKKHEKEREADKCRDCCARLLCMTDSVGVSGTQAGVPSGSARWHPALDACAAAGCSAAAAAPAPPTASAFPREPWRKHSVFTLIKSRRALFWFFLAFLFKRET